MGLPSSTAVAEFERCMQEERRAWDAVAGRTPGTPQHDPAAWFFWVECVNRSDTARRRVQAEVLRPADHTAPPAQDSTPPERAGSVTPSRPVPLSASGGTRLRFNAMLAAAGFQWSQFQTTLLQLAPGDFSGVNFIVTVTCTRLGLSRTYGAAHESGWLTDFQQDLEDGVFSSTNAQP